MILHALLLSATCLPAQAPAPSRTVELAHYAVQDLLGDAATLSTTQDFAALLQRWLLAEDKQLVPLQPEEFLIAASSVARVGLAGNKEVQRRMQELVEWQRREPLLYSLTLTVFECDRAVLDPKLSEREQIAKLRSMSLEGSVNIIQAPKVLVRGAQPVSISTGNEHHFVIDAFMDQGKLQLRHKTVWEGTQMQASIVRLDQDSYGVELEAEFSQLQQPVRTAVVPVPPDNTQSAEISLPELNTTRNRVTARLRNKESLAWNMGPIQTPQGERARLVGLELSVSPDASRR